MPFTKQTAHANQARSAKSRRLSIKAQLIEMQSVLMADVLNPETSAKDRALAARAWKDLQGQLRIERGLANPAAYKAPPPAKVKAKSSVPVEPTLVEPDKAA